MKHAHTSNLIAARIGHLSTWLEDEAPYVQFDQRHLDGGTIEQAYWHLGYLAAMRDVLAQLKCDDDSSPESVALTAQPDK